MGSVQDRSVMDGAFPRRSPGPAVALRRTVSIALASTVLASAADSARLDSDRGFTVSRCVIYCRVSTEEQAASGLGLDAQRTSCLAWAEREGRAVAGMFEEDVSGAAPLDKRPQLTHAILSLTTGDILLVAKRDRLGRDPILVAMTEAAIARAGARTVSAAGEGTDDDSPTSVLMRRMVDAFAEYERLIIRARTVAALDAKRRRNERTGQVPIGRRLASDGRTLQVDAAELAALDSIHHWRSEGRSLRWIAGELTRRGIKPKNGASAWSHSTVAAIVARPSPSKGPSCLPDPSPNPLPPDPTTSRTSSDPSSLAEA